MNQEINTEGYLSLRDSIIKQAFNDYWLADSPISGLKKEEVISFFKSDCYKSLLTPPNTLKYWRKKNELSTD